MPMWQTSGSLRFGYVCALVACMIFCMIGGPQADTLSDPGWGFSFQSPAGWKYQVQPGGALLGHNSIAGAIIVMPHTMGTSQQLQAEMARGLQEDSGYLQLAGKLSTFGQNGFCGAYGGYWDGEQVKARGIGTISPQGGGAIVIALTTPQAYSQALAQAADAVARSISYVQAENPGLISHFAGTWRTSTKHTERMVVLYPDGTYADRYSSGYSGQSSNQYGPTGHWGVAGDQHGRGRWTARGTREQGIFTFTAPNGESEQFTYQVHVEKGQTYWNEYIIDGDLYYRSRE